MLYTLSTRRYFREYGKTYEAGDPIELPEETANEINRNEGPTLTPARLTTQAHPQVIASASASPAKLARPRGRKPRARE